MAESTIQPAEIYIDKIENGRARVLCHWNITTATKDDQTIYTYDEAVLWWTFPYLATDGVTVLDNYAAIEAFLVTNKADIINYARGTQITLVGLKKNRPASDQEKGKEKKEEKEFTMKGNK